MNLAGTRDIFSHSGTVPGNPGQLVTLLDLRSLRRDLSSSFYSLLKTLLFDRAWLRAPLNSYLEDLKGCYISAVDRWTDGRTDGRTGGQTDRQTYIQTDRQTDG